MPTTSIPNIDLGGCVKIIDDTQEPARWKRIGGRIFATRENAKRVLRENGLTQGWLCDDYGNKEYITLTKGG